MGTSYAGDSTQTRSPSAAPGVGVAPTVLLPADGDPGAAALFVQGYQVLADFAAWAMQSDLGTIVGQGGDGNVTIRDGSETTLSKDYAFNNLTLSNSSKIKTAGYTVRVRDTLTI